MSTSSIEGDSERRGGKQQFVRALLAAVVPPMIALGVERVHMGSAPTWLTFTAAVTISSWIGGFASGIVSTLISTTLLWWYFVPPAPTVGLPDPTYFKAAVLFMAMGVGISFVHERLRSARRNAVAALAKAQHANEILAATAKERRLFAALMENSTDFIGIADPTGTPLYVNPAGRRMVGLADDFPIETLRLADMYPPDLRQFVGDVIVRQMVETGAWTGETSFWNARTKQPIPVWDTHFTIDDPDTGQVIGMGTVTRDITLLKLARDELEATNHRLEQTTSDLNESQLVFQAVIDHSPGIIMVKDLDGKLLLFNRKLESGLGMSGRDLRGRTVYDLFPPDVAKRRRGLEEAVIKERKPMTIEETVDLKDGRHVFLATVFPLFDEERTAFGICWIETDITTKKRAEEELQEAAIDLKEAQRVAHLGSWRWNLDTDVLMWSEEMYRIHGRDPTLPPPSYREDFPRMFAPESMAALDAAVTKLRHTGEAQALELEVVLPDGSKRWIAAHGEAIRDANGRIVAIRGTSQDVSEQKELRRLKEEWTSIIAHDLRQPIGAIKMAAELLPDLHAGDMSDKEGAITARISSAAKTLARMVDDLMDVSRLEAHRLTLDPRTVDPRTIVDETVQRLSHLASGTHLVVSKDGALPPVSVDPGRFEQVLGNLISNAVKYGEKDGDIGVNVKPNGTEVEISVTNRGKGISPDEASRIFTRFARSKAARIGRAPGLGLGLYIAKGLVEAHGGRMWVDSVPGETTTFHFTLPGRGALKAA